MYKNFVYHNGIILYKLIPNISLVLESTKVNFAQIFLDKSYLHFPNLIEFDSVSDMSYIGNEGVNLSLF